MGRLLFFLLLALAVYIGWRALRLQRGADGDASAERRPGEAEAMVRCEVCGLNVPQSEALPAPASPEAPRWYCCEAHRRQAMPPG